MNIRSFGDKRLKHPGVKISPCGGMFTWATNKNTIEGFLNP